MATFFFAKYEINSTEGDINGPNSACPNYVSFKGQKMQGI